MISSDVFTVHVHARTGLLGWWDAKRNCAVPPVRSGDKAAGKMGSDEMVSVQMPFACKLLFQELQAMNVLPRISLKML